MVLVILYITWSEVKTNTFHLGLILFQQPVWNAILIIIQPFLHCLIEQLGVSKYGQATWVEKYTVRDKTDQTTHIILHGVHIRGLTSIVLKLEYHSPWWFEIQM